MAEFNPTFRSQQHREYESWQDLVGELKAAGAGDINAGGENESLHGALVKWAEELVLLRMLDPDPQHAENALVAARERYPDGGGR